MTIAVESYLLPRPAELPHNRLKWTPSAQRAVLLVHDMQDYFLRFYAQQQAPMVEALGNMQRLLQRCRERGVPVIYTAQPADPGAADRKLLADLWGAGLTACPEQATITSALAPAAGDIVLPKTRYSAFHRTSLQETMRQQGRDQLWICGVYAHIGCMITAFDAFMNDIKPFLVLDAVMDFSRAHHDLAGKLVSERCGVVTMTEELLHELRAPSTESDVPRLVLGLLGQLVPMEPATPEQADLRDLGLDSVRALELLEGLRSHGVLVESADLLECRTLADLYEAAVRAPRRAGSAVS